MLNDVRVDRALILAACGLNLLESSDVNALAIDDLLSENLVDMNLSHDRPPGIRPMK